jgi:DnaJ-class molecular chaperone
MAEPITDTYLAPDSPSWRLCLDCLGTGRDCEERDGEWGEVACHDCGGRGRIEETRP